MIWGMAMELGVGKILISCLAGRFSLKLRQYDCLQIQYMLGGCLFWGQELSRSIFNCNSLQDFDGVELATTRVGLTERPYEASLFLGISFGLFLRSLGGRRIRPPSGGPEPSVRYHFGRARILTLCQDLRAKGQSQVDSFYEA
ncbi:hypothetical protein Gotur_010713 [Gossypium turneri]